jgi:hypothetical protein
VITNMRRVMTCVSQHLRYDRRQGVVDQKLHDAWSSGISRSRTASAAKTRAA